MCVADDRQQELCSRLELVDGLWWLGAHLEHQARVEGGILVVLEWPAMRDHGAEKRRPSQGEEFGMCNWDRAHVPPEVIRPRIGRHEDCRERQPCQCRHGCGPYASAHRVCHGSREAPSARPAPLASVLLFLDTGCQGGLKKNKQRTCTPSARPLSARGLGRLRGSDHPQRLWRQRCRLAAHSFRGSGSRPSGNRVKRRRLAQRLASEEAEFSGVLDQRSPYAHCPRTFLSIFFSPSVHVAPH